MELHRLLTFAAAVLLAVTLVLYYNSDAPHGGGDSYMQYAYVTGILMLAAFVASFVVFTRQKMNRGFAS